MKWKCPYCGKEFENFLAYVLHMEWHERWEHDKVQERVHAREVPRVR